MSHTPSDPFDVLMAALESFGKIPASTRQIIIDKCVIREYKKGEVILNYGDTCRYVSFILSGVTASMFELYDDERISWVMLQHDVFISILSFYAGAPSKEKIEALEDTRCICLSKHDLDEITSVCIAFKEVRLKLTEYYYQQLALQLYMMHLKPRDRKSFLRTIRPQLFEVAYVDFLARFLGVAKSTLYNQKRPQ